jgi:hypothetical protein
VRVKATIKALLEKFNDYQFVKVFQTKRIPGEFRIIAEPACKDDYSKEGDGNIMPLEQRA